MAQNVYHFGVGNAGPHADQDVVDDCEEFVADIMDPLLNYVEQNVSLELIECYERVLGEWQPLGTTGSTWVGGATGDRLPAGVALLLNFFKTRSGYADRKYIAGITETYVVGDTWTAALLTAGQASCNVAVAGLTGTHGVQLGCVNFNRSTEVKTSWISGVPSSTVSYQRRRKPGVGQT